MTICTADNCPGFSSLRAGVLTRGNCVFCGEPAFAHARNLDEGCHDDDDDEDSGDEDSGDDKDK